MCCECQHKNSTVSECQMSQVVKNFGNTFPIDKNGNSVFVHSLSSWFDETFFTIFFGFLELIEINWEKNNLAINWVTLKEGTV